MTVPEQIAVPIEIPFKFFLYNDGEDLDEFFYWYFDTILERDGNKYEYDHWEHKSEQIDIYNNTILDDWFLSIGVHSYYSEDKQELILTFNVFGRLTK